MTEVSATVTVEVDGRKVTVCVEDDDVAALDGDPAWNVLNAAALAAHLAVTDHPEVDVRPEAPPGRTGDHQSVGANGRLR